MFRPSTSAKLPRCWRCPGFQSTHVPRAYSVWLPLHSHMYLWRSRHPKINEIEIDAHGLDMCLLLRSQLPPDWVDAGGIPVSRACSPCRYPTHILPDNHWHIMCICDGISTRKSPKFTFIDTGSTFDCFYPLNFRQSPSMMEICRNQVHTGTPHMFCLTVTSISCVFVKQQAPKNRSNWRLYSRIRHFTTFMLSTAAKVLQWWRYAGITSTHVPHTHSVSQPLPSYVYLWRKAHPNTGEIQVHAHGLDISLLLCSKLPPKCCNDWDMPESSPHRYPTHILSHNH